MKLALKFATGIGLVVLAASATIALAYSDVVRRQSRMVDDLAPYGDEFRSLEPYGASPSDRDSAAEGYTGPGWYARRAPDGTHVAVTTSWGGFLGDVVLGLLIDRPYIHTVSVWNEASRRLTPVVSIKEADPHSGIAHRYAWSRDSKALLIYGSGRLPEDYDAVLELCVVYLAETDELLRLSHCPPSWQRGKRSAGRAAQQNNQMQRTRPG